MFSDLYYLLLLFFFFFKQKTAYEMRISDWSSDVCSSDLARRAEAHSRPDGAGKIFRRKVPQRQMVSGAGSGAAIAFLPAKASPLRARTAAAHSPRRAGPDPASIAAAKSWTPDRIGLSGWHP